MRRIEAPWHRIVDFTTVLVFALCPTLLGLTGLPAAVSYLLAAVHLAMTLLTRFSGTERTPIPLRLHGAVELVVGFALLALPWLVDWHGSPRLLYVVAGSAILTVWSLSRYHADPGGAPA